MPTYFSRKLNLPFNDVLRNVTISLEKNGFGILSNIDIRETLRDNNIVFRNYKVIGACIPQLAYGALSLESHMGVLLACNIVIQEHENGEVEVSAFNPLETIEKGLTSTHISAIADEVSAHLRCAIDDLHRESFETKDDEALPVNSYMNNTIAPLVG